MGKENQNFAKNKQITKVFWPALLFGSLRAGWSNKPEYTKPMPTAYFRGQAGYSKFYPPEARSYKVSDEDVPSPKKRRKTIPGGNDRKQAHQPLQLPNAFYHHSTRATPLADNMSPPLLYITSPTLPSFSLYLPTLTVCPYSTRGT
jgi:hypothetical protein